METKKLSTDPVFLTGVYRSGTTLLRLMLNAHSRLAIPVESHFLTDLIYDFPIDRKLTPVESERICKRIEEHPRFEHWRTSPEVLKEIFAQNSGMELSALISLIFKIEISTTGKPRWGDKTPGYERHIVQLARTFPTAKFIHIHRDGRDVSNSMRERQWHGITEFQRANYWQTSIRQAYQSAKQVGSDRCLNVSYEDLVRAPVATLKTICTFLGEDYQESMLDFSQTANENVVDQKIHSKLTRLPDPTKDLLRWKKDSTGLRVLLFESLAENALQQAGYELQNGRTARMLTRIAYWVPGFAISRLHKFYLGIPTGWRRGFRQIALFQKFRSLAYQRTQDHAEANNA